MKDRQIKAVLYVKEKEKITNKERRKIFGSGSRTPIAITILLKKKN